VPLVRPREEDLIAAHLVHPRDPVVSALALGTLVSQWTLGREHRAHLLAPLEGGLAWDTDDDVFIRAVSAAGEYLRDNTDRDIPALLLGDHPAIPDRAARRLAREN
jgi:hypothetical protein